MEDEHIAVPAGMKERRLQEVDLEDAHALLSAYHAARAAVQLPLEELRRFTRTRGFSWQKDVFGVTEGDRLVGLGMIWNNDPGSIPDFGFGVTHPDRQGRGIGTYILRRIEARHRQIRAAHPDGPTELRLHGYPDDEAAVALLEGHGFKEIRRTYMMEAELGSYEDPEPLPGFSVAPITSDELNEYHVALEESFADHWGNVPETFEEFHRSNVDRPDTRFDLWLLAREGEDPAGVMLGRVQEGIGWIEALGVKKPYRRRGLGRHLLMKALRLFQEEGLPSARLAVDTQNATGAVALYEGAGMQVIQVSAAFGKG